MKNTYSIMDGNFGLEKENLRVNNLGELSLKNHPPIFGENNQYITTDFSESQIEMITPPCSTIGEAYNFLENLNNIVMLNLEDELLWPQSNPPILPKEAEIPVARYSDGSKEEYRQYLAQKYGRKRAVISGIHFNFSFSDEWLQQSYERDNIDTTKVESFSDFKNELYLKITKHFLKSRWFFIYLFGASPVFHESYLKQCVELSEKSIEGTCEFDGMQSLRNSVCGYRNQESLIFDYSTYKSYLHSVERLIDEGTIRQESEIYSAVRMKSIERNIEYLEFRFLDINPLYSVGVKEDDLKLIHIFAMYYSQLLDFEYSEEEQLTAEINQLASVQEQSEITYSNRKKQNDCIGTAATELLKKVLAFLQKVLPSNIEYQNIVKENIKRIKNNEKKYASIIKQQINDSSYIQYHLEQANTFLKKAKEKSFSMRGFENLELSTQLVIQASLKHGLTVEILDSLENFIRVTNPHTGQVEYIKEATKTSLDTYSQVLVMENKKITKQILDENNISTPFGYAITKIEDGIELYLEGKLMNTLVVKPNSTNFGKGITIFTQGYSKKQLTDALEFAFSEDSLVLLERFQEGKEYRILVVGDEVVAVLHRRSANIKGDGIHTIRELVELKNKDYLRGKGYKTPLEYLQLGKTEVDFLEQQALTPDDVIPEGGRIYLRENSNISTGGDSLDYTDDIDSSYKKIALNAAKALGVQICGVDMIIEDSTVVASKTNYTIIELNFNPAIHIHCYPYRGKNRNVGDKVIQQLFFKK